MFEGIKKCLDDFEVAYTKANETGICSCEEEDNLLYFNLHLAEELMKETWISSEKIAKIILAHKGLLNEIKVKVE
jgi:hypothetical protein